MLKKLEGYYSYGITRGDLKLEHYIYPISIYRYNWHKEIELLVVLKGRAEVSVAGQVYRLQEDDFVLIPPNAGHASLATEPDSVGMVLHLHPKIFSRWLPNTPQMVFQGSTFQQNRYDKEYNIVRYILAIMMQTGLKTDIQAPIVLESYLIMLCAKITEIFPKEKQETSVSLETTQKDIEKITEYIDEHYNENIGLSDISHIFKYNSSYFSRFLKSQLGIGYYEYLTRVRLRYATFDLCDKDKSILEISEMNGFSNLKAFNAAFKKNFGKTPSEYRVQIRGTQETLKGVKKHKKESFPLGSEYIEKKLMGYISTMENLEGEKKSIFTDFEESHLKERKEKIMQLIKKTERMTEELNTLYKEYCR